MVRVVRNEPSPGSGGDDFEFYKEPQLVGIDAWYGWPSHVQDLRGVKLRYTNRDEAIAGTTDGGPHASYNFDRNEKITSMDIWGTDKKVSGIETGFVTGLEFNTTKHQNVLLGDRGDKKKSQTVGNGNFIGLVGRSGADIDALGGVFAD